MFSRPRKTLRVGYPSTPYCWQSSDSSVQSTLMSLMSFSFRVVAASSYSGARALQWPHHGAKTETVFVSCRTNTMSVQGNNVHSARTISFSLTNSSKVSFFSWVTSEAVATAAAASRPQAIFLTEGIVMYLVCLESRLLVCL